MARELDPGMGTGLPNSMTYTQYLQLDQVLSAQRTLSSPPHHDELLFIIIHQTTELWFKLVVHELKEAIARVQADDLDTASKILARVKHVQRLLFDQWAVLTTLTPTEYTQFRDVLGQSSGFQSVQYRTVEFLLGNKDERMIAYHQHDPAGAAELTEVLGQPSLYDVFLQVAARKGLPIPQHVLERDVRTAHQSDPGVVLALTEIYRHPETWWQLYDLAEKLVDVEEHFSLWRFRHMKVVARVIGFKTGTGGSSGVPFLRKMIDHEFFPELWKVRTEL